VSKGNLMFCAIMNPKFIRAKIVKYRKVFRVSVKGGHVQWTVGNT
jgi:hypothetical protein